MAILPFSIALLVACALGTLLLCRVLFGLHKRPPATGGLSFDERANAPDGGTEHLLRLGRLSATGAVSDGRDQAL